ncbi:MAG: M48 family metalloprotease [Herminiimonas sp.]|nr:M48 family metalloprotease [Herminiimonas sp.]
MNASVKALLCWLAVLCAPGVLAQVPETGRWQDLDFSQVDVHSRTADQYWDLLIALSRKNRLDDDAGLVRRATRITNTLIAAAARIRPETGEWDWEIHTTSDPDIDAFCMAGGKLMIGSAFVSRLALDDAELATLIAHEVAHAVADHHREFLSSVLHISPLPYATLDITLSRLDSDLTLQWRMAKLANLQEREADQLGMVLAHQAGWPAAGMERFYRKLADADAPSMMSSSHPPPASRLSMAKGMALLFGQ